MISIVFEYQILLYCNTKIYLNFLYLLEVLKEIKSFYKSKQLAKCYAESLKELKIAYNFLRAKYMKKELAQSGTGTNGSQKKVIDTDFEA